MDVVEAVASKVVVTRENAAVEILKTIAAVAVEVFVIVAVVCD